MTDGSSHVGRGRRSPKIIPVNKPNRTPKRSTPKISDGATNWRKR